MGALGFWSRIHRQHFLHDCALAVSIEPCLSVHEPDLPAGSGVQSLPFWRPKDQEGASTDFYRFIYTLRGSAAAEILMKDTNVLNGINP